MKVVLFYRKRLKGNFSIENLFKQLCENFPEEIYWKKKEVSFKSTGFINRLLIGFEVMLNQGEINHITGDINFAAIFLRKSKTILTIHDIGFMSHSNPIARFILLWFWIKIPLLRSSYITTVSEATKKELLKYVSIDPLKIVVIHNPVSKLFKPLPKLFNTERPVILQVGTKHNKNIHRLIQAIEGISCHLKIVGALDKSILDELTARQVDFTSVTELSDNEIVAVYDQCDIVSFVSTYEGFGIPILEANTVGRVVVSSNLFSMPEVAGNAAHLVDPYSVTSIREGILKVRDEAGYRNNLIENGFANKERFKVEDIAMQYVEIYKTLIRGGNE